jgi:hypothetical protein
MKFVLFIVFSLLSTTLFSQQYLSSSSDTILLKPLLLKKIVLLKLNDVTVGVAFVDFLETLKRTKKSQSKDYRKRYKYAIKTLQSFEAKSDTTILSQDLIKGITTFTVYRYFANNINEGNAIIFAKEHELQKRIVRKKISQSNGMLQGGQASEYYLLGEKAFFFKINDWLS